MQDKYDVVPEASLLFSWEWINDDFKEEWLFLNKKNSENAGETIWKTRLKEVQLLEVPSAEGSYRIAFKNYHEKRFFRYFLRPSLAAREAKGFAIAASLGIPVVKVLAFGEKRKFFNLESAFFITAFEENTETFHALNKMPDQHDLLLSLLKENIIRLAKLHKAGFIHGGAHPRNFIWKKTEKGKIISLWIDLATLRPIPVSQKKRWKYLLTDLSDFTEYFQLSQAELDLLKEEYQKIFPLPFVYKKLTGHPKGKQSEACRE